ncbi:MAG TPA: S8 family serine peptidase [Kiritimatiellia bacterium]|nr:S8 family serine peptidase [Kiritimatiellia bacterium]
MKRLHILGYTLVLVAIGAFWTFRSIGKPGTDGASSFSIERSGDAYTLKAENAPLSEILAELRKLAGLELHADPAMDVRITADLVNQPIEKVLAAVSGSRALVYERSADDDLRLIQARLTSEQAPVNAEDAARPETQREVAARRTSAVPAALLTNSRRSLHELRQDEAPALLFSSAILDTRALVEEGRGLDIPDAFRAPPDAPVQIVQFDRPVSAADREAIEALGASVHHYVPNRAYAVTATSEQFADIQNLAGVYVIEPYHPYFKMSAVVRARLLGDAPVENASEPAPFKLVTFNGADAKDSLEAAGVDVKRVESDGRREVITVEANAEQVMRLLRSDDVQWIEPYTPAAVMNDLGNRRMRVPSLRQLHPELRGDGMVIAVTDTGVDFKHQTFSATQGLPTSTNVNTRIAYYEFREGPFTEGLPGDVDGHGTHVAGSILGNGALSQTVIAAPGSDGPPYGTNQFAGVAPHAKLVMLEDFNSIPQDEQARISHQRGARISNNSWGYPFFFEYGADSALWDALVRDADSTAPGNQELITFFSAGNAGDGTPDGVGATAGTVSMPGNAKNVITMGALEQPRYANNIMGVFFGDQQYFADLETDSDWQVARYSSRGPVSATDLRVKPDLVAPGSFVLSAQSHETSPDDYTLDFSRTDYRFGNVDTGTNYAFFSGTSMASPLGAGAAALVYQHLTNTLGNPPSAALMKAILVAGARTVNSLVYKRPVWDDDLDMVDDGWGLIDVSRSIDGPRIRASDAVILFDQSQTQPLQTGETFTQQISMGPNDGGLRIVLAYTDRPGTPGAGVQLVNNLDLVVFGPNGAIYRGNQFAEDGVHARRFTASDSVLYDQYNNVEAVTIPAGGAGTYSIRVFARQIPDGPQDYAMVIQKGIGYQGRTAGNFPSVALDTNGYPVVAYSQDPTTDGAFSNLSRQIYVRRWVGPYGDMAELGRWKRIEDQWYGIRDSLDFGGISKTLENSEYPSIAVRGDKILVAWEEFTQGQFSAITNNRIFARYFNGSDWIELGGSASGFGVSKNTNGYHATRPAVGIMGDGSPVVAWLQGGLAPNVTRVFVSRWDGTNWVGLAGSHTSGVPTAAATKLAEDLSMVINGVGNPVLAFKEASNPDGIVVLQWTGAAWGNISPADSAPFVEKPRIAAGPGVNNLALAWVQTYGAAPGIFQSYQVYAARYNGAWSAVGGSQTFPGISAATNLVERPLSLDVGVSFNNAITVVWQGGTNENQRSILARRWNVGATNWIDISGSARMPGITKYLETYSTPDVAIDPAGLPVVAFVNSVALTNQQEVQTFTLIGDRLPPVFAGLQTALGGTNGSVTLGWLPAVDDTSSNIIYRIFRGTQTFACGISPSCDSGNVFSNQIATITNLTTFVVTGLTANLTYCFGVRAVDENGLVESNTVIRSSGPVTGTGDNDADCLNNALELAAGTEPCARDTDGDGMWDGWEWTFSTNNLAKTNPISIFNTNVVYLSPIDNGIDNIRTLTPGDGTPDNLPGADPDGDGASNYEEFLWWLNNGASCAITNVAVPAGPNPTAWDTDGDGMPDGWEMLNGLNPIDPSDAAGDLDLDGLTNLQEYQLGTDPRNTDSDGDGLTDGDEVNIHGTNPAVADSDADGLDDGFEVALGSDPRRADSNGNFLADGDAVQLGLSPIGVVQAYNVLFYESFEGTSSTASAWTSYPLSGPAFFNMWHVSAVEPAPDTNAFDIVFFGERSTNRAYRAARDVTPSPGTDTNATYNIGSPVAMALQAPTLTNGAVGVSNLFVAWTEYYETEPEFDQMVVQARALPNTNWVNISSVASGLSGVTNFGVTNARARWVNRIADASAFAGKSNVQVRFLFSVLNSLNNDYRGWWVDDVRVYEGTIIEGWVRDINGRAVQGATVRALGRGGITNRVSGHRFVLPGKIFGEALTAADGSYRIAGLPQGNFYVKASGEGYRDEFYDGVLFTNGYAFGHGFRPGVFERESVSAQGVLGLLSSGARTNAHFELEAGQGRPRLGVALENAGGLTYPVAVNGLALQVWNGSTSTPALVDYVTSTNPFLVPSFPDWLTNAVAPAYMADLAPGLHLVYASTNLPFFPLLPVDLREGESTFLIIETNQAFSRLFVTAETGGVFNVKVNGRLLTNQTPAIVDVRAGLHEVTLVSTGSSGRIGRKLVQAPIGGRALISFNALEVVGENGALKLSAKDPFGNAITSLTVFVNGVAVSTNELVGQTFDASSIVMTGLRPGVHDLAIRKPGYRASVRLPVDIFSGVTSETVVVMYEADLDFDRVGDAIEIESYTNRFLFHRNDDPDNDGLTNLQEFDLFRLSGIRLNIFNADTDGDGLSDGKELGYDGNTNRLALSTLYTNAIQFTPVVRSLFVGRYLEGINNFGSGTGIVASINGDRFVGDIYHPVPAVPSIEPALTLFTNIVTFPPKRAVDVSGHLPGAEIFADSIPNRADTDRDGMWDGFEYLYRTNAAALDLLDASDAGLDPDFDGLSNLQEFLGLDALANTNDWLNPGKADTDGDFMPDGWEVIYGLNPLDPSDAFLDADGDGLLNLHEFLVGTSPLLTDTDADFLPDYEEVMVYMTDPLNPDTDGDGLLDGREVWDRDMDGVRDGGFFPNWYPGADMDGDGFWDGPTDWDTDGDGMPDGFEVLDRNGNIRPEGQRLNPSDPTDADEDPDGDGLTNLQEYRVRDALFGNHPTSFSDYNYAWNSHVPVGWQFPARPYSVNYPVWDYSTDPFNADTDGDGMPDGFEVLYGLHPMDPVPTSYESQLLRFSPLGPNGDLDQDGLWNALEYKIRFAIDGSFTTNSTLGSSTHPWRADSDGDGLVDGFEHHALFANPTSQDTDGDRLPDGMGVSNKWGEVQTVRRASYELVPCPGCSWQDAFTMAASMAHPDNPAVFGQLAVISDIQEINTVNGLITGVETNIALGFYDLVGAGIYSTVSGEPFVFHNFATNEPQVLPLQINVGYMGADGLWGVAPTSAVMDHFVVEWAYASQTNHYDQALNDLWELVWPTADTASRPYWQVVEIDPASPVPPPRWGAAMVYNPAFERKNRRFDGTIPGSRYHYSGVTLLDNRKLIVIGGVDGVDRYTDIWEFSIRSNEWRRSVESMLTPANASVGLQGFHSGVSDFGAVLLMGYRNTGGSCGCTFWDCNGEDFGEPKNRPWNYGFEDSSYDHTYILGGWNDQNEYLLPEPMRTVMYKSTDDPDPVREMNNEDEDVDAWSAKVGIIIERYETNVLVSTIETNRTIGYGRLANNNEQVPVGNYSDSFSTEEKDGDVLTVTTTFRSNFVAGVRFENFPFVPSCDQIVYAGLRLDVSRKPDPTTVFTVIAEYDTVVRTSRDYIEEVINNVVLVPNDHPSTRLNRPFNSTPLDAFFDSYYTYDLYGVATLDPSSDLLEIDVTAIVQELVATGNWQGRSIGFLLMETNGVADYALFREENSRLVIEYAPGYKQPPDWRLGATVQTENGEIPSRRKSFGIVYDHGENKLVLFGGMDGATVFGDTFEAGLLTENDDGTLGDPGGDAAGPSSVAGFVRWTKVPTASAPSPRWGHSMAYDDQSSRIILFGGFDAQNRPLSDLWEYDTANQTWTEITALQDSQKPSPRGGAMMAFYGAEFYKRGAGGDYSSTKRSRIVLFGGTDGKNYYNDTWVLYRDYANFILDQTTGNRWALVDPGGEQSIGPSPRAFGSMVYAQNGGYVRPDPLGFGPYGKSESGGNVAAGASVLLFGGRTGTLPAGSDTDRDLVPDGLEHELGGPAAGRDPRINALVNPNGVETVPYNLKRLGAWPGAMSWLTRSHLADLEVLSYVERGEAWRRRNFTWQGWPIETSFTNEYYVIGDEAQVPFETPATDRVVYVTGIDALSPDWTNMWYHRYPLGLGDPRDSRNVWQLGIPIQNASNSNAAPPYAYSGRWVYGTRLNGFYPSAAKMELYSPIFNTIVPDASTPHVDNANAFFLVFHEWLDLADSNDFVRVDIVRPSTPADIATRVSGLDRPTITVVPNRNVSANTKGKWRRMIVPLNSVGNDSNLYVRFTLQSDTNALTAGGWYIDDIGIMQGAQIDGFVVAGTNVEVCLIGENFNDHIQDCTLSETNGAFGFGFLPLGNYQVVAGGVTSPVVVLSGSSSNVVFMAPAIPEFTGISMNSPLLIQWAATNGAAYRLEATTNLLTGPWDHLYSITSVGDTTLSYTDSVPTAGRIYRVSITNAP